MLGPLAVPFSDGFSTSILHATYARCTRAALLAASKVDVASFCFAVPYGPKTRMVVKGGVVSVGGGGCASSAQ